MLISEDTTRFALDKGEIAVLTSMMADPKKRPILAALWFHPAKGQAWATDGYRAVLAEHATRSPATTATATARPIAIPAITAAHVARTARARDLIVVDVSRDTVAIDLRAPTPRGDDIETFEHIDDRTSSTHTVTCPRHDGHLSSIESFFPPFTERGAKGASVPVNPALLKSAVILAKVADPSYVWLNIGEPDEPIIFAAHGRHSTTWHLLVCAVRASHSPPATVVPAVSTRSRRSKTKAANPSKLRAVS